MKVGQTHGRGPMALPQARTSFFEIDTFLDAYSAKRLDIWLPKIPLGLRPAYLSKYK